MSDPIEPPIQAPGVWIVEYAWTKDEPQPAAVQVLRDAMMKDTPATLDGVDCRVTACDTAVEWNRRTVKFSLVPI